MRVQILVALAVLGSGCFSAPHSADTSSTTQGTSAANGAGTTTNGATGGTTGTTGAASTNGATSTNGTATATGTTTSGISATSTSTGTTTATTAATSTSGTSGTTGGSCSQSSGCPANEVCELSLSLCAGAYVDVSNGGTCHPVADCGGPCVDKPCSSDDDCDLSSACVSGICQGFACAFEVPYCPEGCNLYSKPHSCELDCLCAACPGLDAGAACDVGQPCPSGTDCIFNETACPGLGLEQGALSNGGSCVAQAQCDANGNCNLPCNVDTDCPDSFACQGGTCQILECPPMPYLCSEGCTTVSNPHSCAPYCFCPSCPVDAGAPTGCDPSTCAAPFTCCGDRCVDLSSDTQNCNTCGNACGSGQACEAGQCQTAGCFLNSACLGVDGGNGQPATCCGDQCCGAGSICCLVNSGVSSYQCADANVGCPLGCPMCL
ncbi:MAG: hypothetical protein JST54_09360 [Deltaproteobacteria bacterium]|nr:hypothetical protein [Deltaproteobacteria bacterium]